MRTCCCGHHGRAGADQGRPGKQELEVCTTGCWWLVRQQGCEECGGGKLGSIGQLRHQQWGRTCGFVVGMVEHVGSEVNDLLQVGVDTGSVHDVFGGMSNWHEQHGQ